MINLFSTLHTENIITKVKQSTKSYVSCFSPLAVVLFQITLSQTYQGGKGQKVTLLKSKSFCFPNTQVCPSVGWSVRRSGGPSVGWYVRRSDSPSVGWSVPCLFLMTILGNFLHENHQGDPDLTLLNALNVFNVHSLL